MKSINLAHIKEDFENPILGFFGEHRWLSNFWSAKIILDEIEFPTAEHAYVYSKGFFSEEQLKTLLAATAGQAKRIGKSVELYDSFMDNRIKIMTAITRRKYSLDNPELRNKLLATRYKDLVELNT